VKIDGDEGSSFGFSVAKVFSKSDSEMAVGVAPNDCSSTVVVMSEYASYDGPDLVVMLNIDSVTASSGTASSCISVGSVASKAPFMKSETLWALMGTSVPGISASNSSAAGTSSVVEESTEGESVGGFWLSAPWP
jgi:hypothetical protein